MDNVRLNPWQNLEIWCDEHHEYHRMSYEHLISLVPGETAFRKGIPMPIKFEKSKAFADLYHISIKLSVVPSYILLTESDVKGLMKQMKESGF